MEQIKKNQCFQVLSVILFYGPGHNSFTIDEEGKQDILVYHASTRKKMIIVIHWKIQTDMRIFSHLHGIKNGLPNFGEPGVIKA